MSQTLKAIGTPVNFGLVSTTSDGGVTSTNLTGYLLQSASVQTGAEVESVRSLQGDTTAQNYYDLHHEATLRFVISASSKANAITATSLANFQPGSIISITACASNPDLVNSYWIVQPGASIPQEITKSAELNLPLKRYAAITAVQS
jgi:hypothetical protein